MGQPGRPKRMLVFFQNFNHDAQEQRKKHAQVAEVFQLQDWIESKEKSYLCYNDQKDLESQLEREIGLYEKELTRHQSVYGQSQLDQLSERVQSVPAQLAIKEPKIQLRKRDLFPRHERKFIGRRKILIEILECLTSNQGCSLGFV
ncbi:MAG: hypothetical protein QNL04_01445 [SAR324 cluster bacterium]|nr:hypothetical protein [SAR324 cluster bacterium]